MHSSATAAHHPDTEGVQRDAVPANSAGTVADTVADAIAHNIPQAPPDTAAPLPSLALLSASIGQLWELSYPGLPPLQVRLVHAAAAGAMNRQFVCYNAEFAVCDGTRPPSLNYRARCDAGEWDLLFNPIGPGEDGLELIQTVIHTRR